MTLEVKNLDAPDDTRTFDHGQVQVVNVAGVTVGRAVFEPGWRWSHDVKPIVGTNSCEVAHTGYVISGHLHVKTDDGTERELGPGDAYVLSPGHDAWVVGDQACVGIDWVSMATYATPPS
jgi:quercetin dioxygenase-like cupin family protein